MDSYQVATDDICLLNYTVRNTLTRELKPPRPPRSRSKSKSRDQADFPLVTCKIRGRSSSRDPESPTSPVNESITLIGYRPLRSSSCHRSASIHASSAPESDYTTSSPGIISSDLTSPYRSLRTSRELKMEREKRRHQLRSRSASNDSLKRHACESESGSSMSLNPWWDPMILPPPKGFQDSSGSNSPPTTLSDESETISDVIGFAATRSHDVELREHPNRERLALSPQRPKTTPLPVIMRPPWTAPSLGPRRTILFPPLTRDVEFWRTSATQGRFQMRSTRSVIEYTTTGVHYRVRSELIAECYQSSFDVSETESEDEDDDSRSQKPSQGSEDHQSTSMTSLNHLTKPLSSSTTTGNPGSAPLRNNKSPPSPSVESARLSSSSTSTTNSSNSGSSNISSISSACSASLGSGTHEVDATSGLNSDADADSGIDGVSPRLSLAVLDSNAHSPTHSLLFIDSTSPRNSCMVVDATVTQETVTDCAEKSSESARTTVEDVEAVRRDRAQRVALELLTTERSYVAILHLLDQVFQFRVDQENRAHVMFPAEIVPQMFSNIKSLFKLHHDFLLPKLEERLAHWEENPRLGDIMANFAPFLKMYAEYVRNFDHAVTLITNMANKCPRFASILDEIHQLPECGGLALQHNMLTPIQRVPRYQLLLRDYLKRLPDESLDRADTERALQLVSEAAKHANEAMRKIEQFKQLLEIQEALGGAVDLVSPTRELLKEGKIVKISARSGDHQERYLFLFSDLLLLCSPRLMAATKVMGGAWLPYRLRAKFSVSHLTIMEGDNLETANTFYLRDGAKTVELYTQTVEEKEAWLEALGTAMADLTRRKSSLRVSPTLSKEHAFPPADSPNGSLLLVGGAKLGKVPPPLEKIESVPRCTDCEAQFSVVKRRHHCHACGKVVCSRCSSHKVPLAYDGYKPSKVCRSCYAALSSTPIITLDDLPSSNCPSPDSEKINIHSGLLEVPVNSPSVLSGFLSLKTRGKVWTRRWFALRVDFVLYSYKNSSNESRAMTATPVPGYSVNLVSGDLNTSTKSNVANGAGEERERCFKLSHSRKSYHFQACSREDAEKWVTYLQMASKADFSQLPAT